MSIFIKLYLAFCVVKIPIIFGENNFKPIRYLYERPTIIPDNRVLKPRSNIVLTVADSGRPRNTKIARRPSTSIFLPPTNGVSKVMFSVVCLSFCLFTGSPQHTGCQPCPHPYRGSAPSTQPLYRALPPGNVQTCSVWTLLYRDPLPLDMFKHINYAAYTVEEVGSWHSIETLSFS